MKKLTYNHRFFDRIKEDYLKGNTFFYLYGNPLFDDFFENITLFTANAIDSLAFNLFVQLKVKKIFLIEKDKGVSEFEINQNNNKIHWKNLSYEELLSISGSKNRSSSPTDKLRENSQNENVSPSELSCSCSDTALLNLFRVLTEVLKKAKQEIAVIVNSLEWMANLFENVTPNLQFLSEIEKWRNINEIKPLVFLLMKKIDIIKKFYQFDENDSGVVAVAGPTIWEISQLYKRLSKCVLTDNTLLKISMMIRNHNYSLHNAIYLYKTIINEIGENFKEDEFYNCIKEKLRSIEEDVSWDDIHIDSHIKEKLMTKFEIFLNSGGDIKKGSKGFILAGPPGTGKTMIAKALANMGGFYFMPVKLADLKGEFLGHSGKNVQRIFQIARANAPSLIFIDEADAVFPKRRNAPNWDSYVQEITNQFLAEIDGVDTGKQDIFVLIATNRDDIIDPAVKSRLETIYIGLPSKIARLKILQNFLSDFNDKELCQYFIENSEGLSGRDIKNLSEEIRILKEKYGNYKDALEIAFLNNISKTIYKASRLLNIKFDNLKDKKFFDKVVYFKKLKDRLLRNFQILTNKDIYTKCGLKPLNGCLIYGPEGNGKALLAELVAVELNLKRITLDCQMLSGTYSDIHFEDLISEIIKIASLNKIMFLLKDIDKLLSGGIFQIEDENYFLRKNLMILREHKNIILVATTDSDIDIQKKLPEVFDFEISFDILNGEVDDVELSSIFNRLLNDDKFETDERTIQEQINNFKERLTDDLPLKISDIINLCNKAKYNAVLRLKNNLEKKIVITDIDFI